MVLSSSTKQISHSNPKSVFLVFVGGFYDGIIFTIVSLGLSFIIQEDQFTKWNLRDLLHLISKVYYFFVGWFLEETITVKTTKGRNKALF